MLQWTNMKNDNFFQKTFLYFLSAFFLIAAYAVNLNNEKPLMFVAKQDQAINFNASLFSYLNLGLKRLISSTLWTSTIIESDVEHYKKKDLNSWMFLRFNLISELDPQFYENYSFGGPYLSIIKDDIEGASIIYKKGLIQYPNDYSLLKDASFHFYFEAEDMSFSLKLFEKLKNYPQAPFYLQTARARAAAGQGNLNEALAMLTEMQSKFPLHTSMGARVFEYRYSIKAEIDLDCLNNKNENCSTVDLENRPYALKDNVFQAQREWTIYRPKWRK